MPGSDVDMGGFESIHEVQMLIHVVHGGPATPPS